MGIFIKQLGTIEGKQCLVVGGAAIHRLTGARVKLVLPGSDVHNFPHFNGHYMVNRGNHDHDHGYNFDFDCEKQPRADIVKINNFKAVRKFLSTKDV